MTLGEVFVARTTVMADTGEGPHVVQRPHNRLATVDNLTDAFQRKESLIDPMQMNDVCFLEFRQRRDVCSRIGNVYLKQVVLFESIGLPDNYALPDEAETVAPAFLQGTHRDLSGFLVAYQHLCLDAIIFQGFHQSVGGNGCPTGPFGSIYD